MPDEAKVTPEDLISRLTLFSALGGYFRIEDLSVLPSLSGSSEVHIFKQGKMEDFRQLRFPQENDQTEDLSAFLKKILQEFSRPQTMGARPFKKFGEVLTEFYGYLMAREVDVVLFNVVDGDVSTRAFFRYLGSGNLFRCLALEADIEELQSTLRLYVERESDNPKISFIAYPPEEEPEDQRRLIKLPKPTNDEKISGKQVALLYARILNKGGRVFPAKRFLEWLEFDSGLELRYDQLEDIEKKEFQEILEAIESL